jgi:hypothetical protein
LAAPSLENAQTGFIDREMGLSGLSFSKPFPDDAVAFTVDRRIYWHSGISLSFQGFVVLLAAGSRLPGSLIFDRSLMESKLIDGLAAFYLKQEGLVP